MKKILTLLTIILMSVVLISCQGNTNTFIYELDETYTEYLVMGTSADYPPYEWPEKVNGKTQIVGIDIEIAKRIAKSQKKNLKVINKNFDFLLEDLENKKLDFVMAGLSPNEEREKKVSFSQIYYYAEQVLLINKKDKNKFQNIEDINKSEYKIAAQLGSVQQQMADELFPDSQKQIISDISNMIMNLRDNKITAILLEKPVASKYLDSFKDLEISDIKIESADNGSAVAVNKENKKLLSEIDIVLTEMIENNEIEQIVYDMTVKEITKSDKFFLFDPYYIKILLKGLLMTVILSIIAVSLGTLLGFIPAFGRRSNNKVISFISTTYIEVIRGTPLLVQLLLMYTFIKIPLKTFLGIDLSSFIPGTLALIINSSAYVAEIIRGGIDSIDSGQLEASLSLGMTEKQSMKKIILPQAIKNIIPSLGNEFVSMIKETSIFMYLGVAELMYAASIIKADTYAIKETYIVVALLYLCLTIPVSKLMTRLERKYKNE